MNGRTDKVLGGIRYFLSTARILVYACFLITGVQAADMQVSGFQGNGEITWTNATPGDTYCILWTPELNQQWQASYNAMQSIQATAEVMTAAIPMFYTIARHPDCSGLVADYPLACTAMDYSTNANDGVVYDAVCSPDGTRNGACYYFNGTNAFINCGDSEVFQLNSNLTICCRFNCQGTGIIQCLAGQWSSTSGYSLAVSGMRGTFIKNNSIRAQTPELLESNHWYHMAATYSDADYWGDRILSVYLDGVLVTSKVDAARIIPANTNFLIGVRDARSPQDTYRNFQGHISNVRVYNRTLSEEEIRIISQTD